MSQKEIITERMFSMLEKQAIEIIGETNEFYRPRTVCIGFDSNGKEIKVILNPLSKGDVTGWHEVELELSNGFIIEKIEKVYFMGMDIMGYGKFERETICYLEKRIDFKYEEEARLQGFADY
jgi:hypothetical protein